MTKYNVNWSSVDPIQQPQAQSTLGQNIIAPFRNSRNWSILNQLEATANEFGLLGDQTPIAEEDWTPSHELWRPNTEWDPELTVAGALQQAYTYDLETYNTDIYRRAGTLGKITNIVSGLFTDFVIDETNLIPLAGGAYKGIKLTQGFLAGAKTGAKIGAGFGALQVGMNPYVTEVRGLPQADASELAKMFLISTLAGGTFGGIGGGIGAGLRKRKYDKEVIDFSNVKDDDAPMTPKQQKKINKLKDGEIKILKKNFFNDDYGPMDFPNISLKNSAISQPMYFDKDGFATTADNAFIILEPSETGVLNLTVKELDNRVLNAIANNLVDDSIAINAKNFGNGEYFKVLPREKIVAESVSVVERRAGKDGDDVTRTPDVPTKYKTLNAAKFEWDRADEVQWPNWKGEIAITIKKGVSDEFRITKDERYVFILEEPKAGTKKTEDVILYGKGKTPSGEKVIIGEKTVETTTTKVERNAYAIEYSDKTNKIKGWKIEKKTGKETPLSEMEASVVWYKAMTRQKRKKSDVNVYVMTKKMIDEDEFILTTEGRVNNPNLGKEVTKEIRVEQSNKAEIKKLQSEGWKINNKLTKQANAKNEMSIDEMLLVLNNIRSQKKINTIDATDTPTTIDKNATPEEQSLQMKGDEFNNVTLETHEDMAKSLNISNKDSEAIFVSIKDTQKLIDEGLTLGRRKDEEVHYYMKGSGIQRRLYRTSERNDNGDWVKHDREDITNIRDDVVANANTNNALNKLKTADDTEALEYIRCVLQTKLGKA